MHTIDLNPQQITLTDTELHLVNYIYAHLDQIPFVSITHLAKDLSISTATLSRSVRRLGFSSFKGLKEIIAKESRISPAYKMEKALNESLEPYNHLFMEELQHLEDTMQHMNKTLLNEALTALHKAETLHIYGKGAAYGLAYILSFRFNRFKKNTRLMDTSGSSLFESLHLVKDKDLVVLFAFNKMPLESKLLLEHQKKVGYNTLVISDRLYFNQEQQGHIQLYVNRGDENNYHSMVTPMAMIDSLVVQYAKTYPSETLTALKELFKLKESYAKQLPR